MRGFGAWGSCKCLRCEHMLAQVSVLSSMLHHHFYFNDQHVDGKATPACNTKTLGAVLKQQQNPLTYQQVTCNYQNLKTAPDATQDPTTRLASRGTLCSLPRQRHGLWVIAARGRHSQALLRTEPEAAGHAAVAALTAAAAAAATASVARPALQQDQHAHRDKAIRSSF